MDRESNMATLGCQSLPLVEVSIGHAAGAQYSGPSANLGRSGGLLNETPKGLTVATVVSVLPKTQISGIPVLQPT